MLLVWGKKEVIQLKNRIHALSMENKNLQIKYNEIINNLKNTNEHLNACIHNSDAHEVRKSNEIRLLNEALLRKNYSIGKLKDSRDSWKAMYLDITKPVKVKKKKKK